MGICLEIRVRRIRFEEIEGSLIMEGGWDIENLRKEITIDL